MTLYIPLKKNEYSDIAIQNGLKSIRNINSIKIERDKNSSRAVIQTEKPEEVLPKAVEIIRNLGCEVPTLIKTHPVINLSCASCAKKTENTLQKQFGVVQAEVNYANNSAKIEFIPDFTSSEKLKKVVQSIGYDLIVEQPEQAKKTLKEVQKINHKKLKKKIIGATIFAIPLFLIGMFFMDMAYANWIMWFLSTPMVFYFGKQFFVGAWKQLKHKSANMDTLVALSTGTAYLYSVFVTLFPHVLFRNEMHPHVYFETVGIVITFILLGKLLEEKAKGNTDSALRKLMQVQPKNVTVIRENSETEIPVSEVILGDIVLVKPGERIAVDGEVTSGFSYVDESMINGESIPVLKEKGTKVFAGTINQKGSFHFVAEKIGSRTILAQIIKTVEQAQASKAPIQKYVDKIARIFVPIVMLIAVLSFMIWLFLGGNNSFVQALNALVTVLVIACPCALGLATPTAIMVGIGKGAEQGILIKDAESLEIAKKINTIVLDKTGTITQGKPKVTRLKWIEHQNQELSNILYSIEKSSEHPLADAIANYLKDNSCSYIPNIQIEIFSGKGIQGTYNNQTFYIGNTDFIKSKNSIITDQTEQEIDIELNKAKTVVLFTNEKEILAIISLSDPIKETSKKAIEELHQKGNKIYMLTGDNPKVAQMIARQTNIDDFRANVLPSEKANFVKKLQNQGKIVAMVGDGINDSAALAQADVSIAMGKGSDIAMDVSSITIISSDLTKISKAIDLSKYTSKAIRQNLFWAFIYNLIGIPVATGVLYPINGFLLDPMWAGAAMAFSSVSVVINSLRLKRKEI